MSRRGLCAAVALGLSTTVNAFGADAPTPADLAKCAAIAAQQERLACYDALAHRGAATKPAAPAAAATLPPSPASLQPSQRPAPAALPPANVAASGSASAKTAPTPEETQSFGLSPRPIMPPSAPRSIRARVTQVSEDRFGYLSVILDSGQTWIVTEAGALVRPGDQVTIKRGSLGSYLLVAPDRRSYRTRRTQ